MANFNEDYMSQLEAKMKEGGDAYEVLQFVMSFIARKKTHLDADAVSQLIFRGATYLAEEGSPTYASTLLAWYLDGNAGEDKTFQVNDGAFSDVQRLTALLDAVSNEAGERVLDGVYKLLLPMFHSVNKESQGSLHTMHTKWVAAFEAGGNWFAAFFSALIVKDYSRAASICKSWAAMGFKSEGPLFFARCALYLFAEGRKEDAAAFVAATLPHIEAVSANATRINIAVWHATEMMGDIISSCTGSDKDRTRAFIIMSIKYKALVSEADPKLAALFDRAGQHSFGVAFKSQDVNSMNPMAMLSQMMGGLGGPRAAALRT